MIWFMLTGMFVLGALCRTVAAQQAEIIFEHLSIEQGLSQSNVLSIVQDQKGFLWFGTDAGVNKYDGYAITIYQPDPHILNSIEDTRIQALCVDSQGTLWIGTRNFGLQRFNRDRNDFSSFQYDSRNPQSISHNTISIVYEDRRKNLWIGTQGGGLNLFDRKNNRFVRYQHDPADPGSVSDNTIYALYEDRAGNFWIGTADGLNLLNRETGRCHVHKKEAGKANSLSNNAVYAICETPPGILWIGTDDGLNSLERHSGRFSLFRNIPDNPHSLSHNQIRCLYNDPTGKIWIGTWGGGLNLFDPDKKFFQSFKNNPLNLDSLSADFIYAICEDRSGVVWVGTYAGGANKFTREKKKFAHYKKEIGNPNSLNDSMIFEMCEDKDEMLWIATFAGGLNCFDHKRNIFRHYVNQPGNPNSIPANRVAGICLGRNSVIWICTVNGFSKFHIPTERFKNFFHEPNNPNSLIHNRTISVYEDSSGNVWIGTSGGLDRFEPETERFTHFIHDPANPTSLSQNSVYCIFQDRSGTLWVGTENGLNRFNPGNGQFSHYFHDAQDLASISNNSVYGIMESRSGELWISTTGGINRMDRSTGKFTSYTVTDGLPNNVAYGMLEDSAGNLWISTNNGLAKFNPRTKKFRIYTVHDGLQSNEFDGAAFFQNRRGEMFFGGINGLNIFRPEEISDSPTLPAIVLTDFKLFNRSLTIGDRSADGHVILEKPIDETDHIVLSFRDRAFSLGFAALHFASPEKNRYAYKMEGLEENWSYADASKRFHDYNNLPPGKYVFRVRGSNSDEVWNNAGIALRIEIIPPFWKRWWFYLLVGSSIVLASLSIFQWRVRSLKQKKRELESLVALRTQELREASLNDPLTGLRNRRFISEVLAQDISAFISFKKYILANNNNRRQGAESQVFGIFLFDLDHFKKVNDQFGHEAGDRVLIQFANILKSSVREDDVVIRIGGEEFLVILKKTAAPYLAVYAEKIRMQVEKTSFTVAADEKQKIQKTCSVGYVAFPFIEAQPELFSLEKTIMLADLGLYQAKANGRNLSVKLNSTGQTVHPAAMDKMVTSLEYALEKRLVSLHIRPEIRSS